MKNIRIFYLKNFHFLVVNFSVYLNRLVFVMYCIFSEYSHASTLYLIFLFNKFILLPVNVCKIAG